MIKIIVETETTIKKVSNRYNVSAELLSLFNSYTNTEIIKPNAIVKVPLVETNYYKNTSIKANQGFLPLYYIADEKETVADVSRRFLIAEGTLYNWNNFKSQNIEFGRALQIGWLKDNNALVQINNTSITMQSENNLSYTPNNTFKEDIKSDYRNAKNKISKSFKQLGTNIKKITTTKSKETLDKKEDLGLINDTVIKQNKNETEIVLLPDTIPSVVKKENNVTKIDVKKRLENSRDAIGKSFSKFGESLNKTIDKVGGAKNKSYTKEKLEKEERIKVAIEKENQVKETANIAIVSETKKEIADVEIVNTDLKNTLKEENTKEISQIPTYQKENEDAVLYTKEEVDKKENEIVKPVVNIDMFKKINPKSGKAITFYAGANGLHLAYTDYAPKGSKILVENKKNGKKIEATVLGPLLKNSENEEGIFILLSDTVKKELMPSGENFMVEISKIID